MFSPALGSRGYRSGRGRRNGPRQGPWAKRSWVSVHLTGGPAVDTVTSTSSPPLKDEGAKAQGRAAAGDHPRGEEAAQLCSQPPGVGASGPSTVPFSADRSCLRAAGWLIVCVHDASQTQTAGGVRGGSRAHAGQRAAEAPSSSLHSGCDPPSTHGWRGGGLGRPFGAARAAGQGTRPASPRPQSASSSLCSRLAGRSVWPTQKHPLYFSITQSQLKI